jgi:hypothetical protein
MGGGKSTIRDPVLRFFDNAGRWIAKTATTYVGKMVPVIGEPLANKLNSLYAKGGKVTKRFEAGGVVPDGFREKVINTPAQLIQQIKKYPEVAKQSGLTVEMVKDAVKELKGVATDASAKVADAVAPAKKEAPAMEKKEAPAPAPAPLAPAPPAPGMKNGGLAMRCRGRGGF